MPRPVLVLDLDGTACVGEFPVLAYAEAIESLDPAAAGLRAGVLAFLADPAGRADLLDAHDGYQAAQLLSERVGVNAATREQAYRTSRARIDRELGDVAPPAGFAALLHRLDAHVVLATNSPADGLDSLLAHLGLTALLAGVRTGVGKPAGLYDVLAGLLHEHGLRNSPAHLLSVGDIWRNDLQPAIELGCLAAYVDTYGRRHGPAHVSAATLPELYPAIEEWAASPSRFADQHPLPEGAAVGAPAPQLSWSPTVSGPGHHEEK